MTGKDMRRCCDSLNAKGERHIKGCPSIKAIADNLLPHEREGLCSKPGLGDLSHSTLDRLVDKGLMDWDDFVPTRLGYQIREHLGVRHD